MKPNLPLITDVAALAAGVALENQVGTGNPIEAVKIGASLVGGLNALIDTATRNPRQMACDVVAFGVGVGVEAYLSGGVPNPIEAVKTGTAILGAYKIAQHALRKPAAPTSSASLDNDSGRTSPRPG